jgi:Fe2+ or Zn2+ uptake regulation protein
VIEFVEKELKDLEKRLSKRHCFQIIDHRLDIIGTCSECRKGEYP